MHNTIRADKLNFVIISSNSDGQTDRQHQYTQNARSPARLHPLLPTCRSPLHYTSPSHHTLTREEQQEHTTQRMLKHHSTADSGRQTQTIGDHHHHTHRLIAHIHKGQTDSNIVAEGERGGQTERKRQKSRRRAIEGKRTRRQTTNIRLQSTSRETQ